MGEDRKPPAAGTTPEAPTRKARKFELDAALAEQRRTAKSSLYDVDDEDERTQVRRPPVLHPPEEDAPAEETGRAFYNPPEDVHAVVLEDDARPTEPPRRNTQPVPAPAAPITAPLAPPIAAALPQPAVRAPPPFAPSVPPAVPAIPPGPHPGLVVHVPPPPALPLDGDELAAITRDFQKRRRRVFGVVGLVIVLVVLGILVHEPLLEAIRGW